MQTNLVLAALAGLLAIPTVYTLIEESESFTDFEKVPYLFEGFVPDNVGYIVLSRQVPTKPDADPAAQPAADPEEDVKKLVFIRQGRRWILGPPHPLAGVPIQKERIVEDILHRMGEIRLEEKTLITDSATASELEARDLTEGTGLLIQCLNADQKPVAELYKGVDASGGKVGQEAVRGFFVRPKNKDSILLYEVPYWHMTVRAQDWIERTIHSVKAVDVRSFTVRNGMGEMSVRRATADDPWEVVTQPDGTGAVRRLEVDRLLQRFTYMSCDRYFGLVSEPEWADKVPNDNAHKVYVEVQLEDGTSRKMWVGDRIDQALGHYGYFEGLGHKAAMLVEIHDALVEPFTNNPRDLFDPSAEQVGPPEPEKSNGAPDPQNPK